MAEAYQISQVHAFGRAAATVYIYLTLAIWPIRGVAFMFL